MITGGDRTQAWKWAEQQEQFHKDRSDKNNRITSRFSDFEIHYIGALGEIEFANMFGVSVDMAFRPGGDKQDFFIDTIAPRSGRKKIQVDVKLFTYESPETRLLVPKERLVRTILYVGGYYRQPWTLSVEEAHKQALNSVELICWSWGRDLTFPWGKGGVRNMSKLFTECRPLGELRKYIFVPLNSAEQSFVDAVTDKWPGSEIVGRRVDENPDKDIA